MGTYSRSEILAAVRKELDEIRLNDASFITADTDGEDLDKIILHQFGEALTFAYSHADITMIKPVQVAAADISINAASAANAAPHYRITDIPPGKTVYVGKAKLGEDFLRLGYARCASWIKDVVDPVLWDSAEAAQLHSWFSTGTPQRPKVLVERDADGYYYAYLYTVLQGDTIKVAVINKPSYDEHNIGEGSNASFTMNEDRLYAAVVTYTAALTLATLQDEHANSLFNLALNKMGVATNNANG